MPAIFQCFLSCSNEFSNVENPRRSDVYHPSALLSCSATNVLPFVYRHLQVRKITISRSCFSAFRFYLPARKDIERRSYPVILTVPPADPIKKFGFDTVAKASRFVSKKNVHLWTCISNHRCFGIIIARRISDNINPSYSILESSSILRNRVNRMHVCQYKSANLITKFLVCFLMGSTARKKLKFRVICGRAEND